MLQESRLFTFLDQKNDYAIYFLEGQKLIHDLVLINQLPPQGLQYFRNAVLTAQPIMAFLKHNEGLGIYIDSNSPYFRLKIETNHTGAMRTLLLPNDFKEFPEKITGEVRITKLLPKAPYTSIIKVQNLSYEEVINKVFTDSYQVDSRVYVSDVADQSFIVNRLPQTDEDVSRPGLEDYYNSCKNKINPIFKLGSNDVDQLISEFQKIGFTYLQSTEVKFFCPCSKERTLRNLMTLTTSEIEELFHQQDFLTVTCDYCKKNYKILREDIDQGTTIH